MPRSKGYGQYCPIARAAEILTERWVPLIVRELSLGSTRFNQLQAGLPRVSPALLSARLKDLEIAGILERTPAKNGRGSEYHITEAGMALFPILEAMGNWAQHWMRTDLTADQNLDPDTLMWDIRRTVSECQPPSPDRYVARFDFSGVPASRRRYWIMFADGDVDLCIRDPGFEPRLFISAHIRDIVAVWLGHLSLDRALRNGSVRLDGTRPDQRKFRDWFALNHFAPAAKAALARASVPLRTEAE